MQILCLHGLLILSLPLAGSLFLWRLWEAPTILYLFCSVNWQIDLVSEAEVDSLTERIKVCVPLMWRIKIIFFAVDYYISTSFYKTL